MMQRQGDRIGAGAKPAESVPPGQVFWQRIGAIIANSENGLLLVTLSLGLANLFLSESRALLWYISPALLYIIFHYTFDWERQISGKGEREREIDELVSRQTPPSSEEISLALSRF